LRKKQLQDGSKDRKLTPSYGYRFDRIETVS